MLAAVPLDSRFLTSRPKDEVLDGIDFASIIRSKPVVLCVQEKADLDGSTP